MKCKVFEMTQEWMKGENGAVCKFLGEIEAVDCFEAIKKATIEYPDKPLRVTDGSHAVEHKEGRYAIH